VVECLSSKYEALHSSLVPPTKKREDGREEEREGEKKERKNKNQKT
jgi:hypothetical protein